MTNERAILLRVLRLAVSSALIDISCPIGGRHQDPGARFTTPQCYRGDHDHAHRTHARKWGGAPRVPEHEVDHGSGVRREVRNPRDLFDFGGLRWLRVPATTEIEHPRLRGGLGLDGRSSPKAPPLISADGNQMGIAVGMF